VLTYDCLALPTTYVVGPTQGIGIQPYAVTGAQPEYQIITDMKSSINPAAEIGLISAENYDENRDTMKSLAIVGPGQQTSKKAFLPDSDGTSRDRHNVRDGHYVVQGPLHMIAQVGHDDNTLKSDMAQRFVNWMQGKPGMPGENPLPFNIIDVFASSGVVPQCAMKVIRTSECGPFKQYKDPAPCGCYFESKATGIAAPAGCVPCGSTAECGGGRICSYGFCE